jgi:hypothetical protein
MGLKIGSKRTVAKATKRKWGVAHEEGGVYREVWLGLRGAGVR